MAKKRVVFLTSEEISALSVLAKAVISNDGVVHWALPINAQWLAELNSAYEELDKKVGEIDNEFGGQ